MIHENLPAGQAMHSAVPVWLVYLPAMHGTQGPPLGPDEPALHVQLSTESLPDGEVAWVGQLEHAVVPICAAYFPAPHATHSASPSLAVCLPVHISDKESKGIACAEPNSPPNGRHEPGPHRPQRLLHEMDGHVGADAGVSKVQVQT